jgi:hypothetical protein
MIEVKVVKGTEKKTNSSALGYTDSLDSDLVEFHLTCSQSHVSQFSIAEV